MFVVFLGLVVGRSSLLVVVVLLLLVWFRMQVATVLAYGYCCLVSLLCLGLRLVAIWDAFWVCDLVLVLLESLFWSFAFNIGL